MRAIRDYSLYLILSSEHILDRTPLEVGKSAVRAGVDIIQMREKSKSAGELSAFGRQLAGICKKNSKTFIVNDDPYLAKEVNADGVHLGQEDLDGFPLDQVRKILDRDKIIGLSTHSVAEVIKANAFDVDYIAFGPLFSTVVKHYTLGLRDVARVMNISGKPVFFIGGINLDNVDSVLAQGARNIALMRSVTEAGNPAEAVGAFKTRLRQSMASEGRELC